MAMPESVRSLPFIHYTINANGALLYDVRRGEAIARTEMPWERAVEVLTCLDAYPVLYDCYQFDRGWISKRWQEACESYAINEAVLHMFRYERIAVPDLKAHLAQTKHSVQKIMGFFLDGELREKLRRELSARFPDLTVTNSLSNNLEFNAAGATKGRAIAMLAEHLGLDISRTMAFGDDTNDVTMLQTAGIGVAMGNASPEALAAADMTTLSCDESGVAAALRRLRLID
jgi:Cof subfamily protein (haloacid dehalogenase superfamily)